MENPLNTQLEALKEVEEEEEEEEEVPELRYERQITELLVIILELNKKIDKLTLTTSREDDEYLETCSDFSDNQGRFPDQDHSTDSNCLGQPRPTSVLTSEACDLSRTLHRVLTDIEDTVRTHKTEIPHCGDDCEEEKAALACWEQVTQMIEEVERELAIDLNPELREERKQWEVDMECLRQKNQQLRDQFQGKDQELQSTLMAIGRIQQERDKLRLKADELLLFLHDVQQRESDPSSPSIARRVESDPTYNELKVSADKDPGFAFDRFMQSFQDCSNIQEFSRFFHVHEFNVTGVRIQDSVMEADKLRNSIDEWKERNNLLSRVLQECKGDGEQLSMLLSKHESNSTALHLALQYSEDCIEAYGKLLVKAQTIERHPDAGEPKVDSSIAQLRGDVARLRQGYTAMKQTILNLEDISPDLKRYQQGQAGFGGCVITPAGQELVLPGFSSPSPGILQRQSKGKKELQDDLMTVREDISWSKSQLNWTKKEKKDLEQKLQSQDAQDEAIILLHTHWQKERDDWLQEGPRTDCARQETKSASKSTTCNEELVSELTMISKREKHLRDQIEKLTVSLGRLIENNNHQTYRSDELATELRKTYRTELTSPRGDPTGLCMTVTQLLSLCMHSTSRQKIQLIYILQKHQEEIREPAEQTGVTDECYV
ncbi:colorectal mutant cancer protein-like isoform X2 [Narcine bancroftii]|uniref:colorectal mutant cancer protein-like isoform X2 n=1 Tax=Narcine bancroftii TaxID=1343680 RepID=UPI003831AA9D